MDVRRWIVFADVTVFGHQFFVHYVFPLATLDVSQAQRVRAVQHVREEHGRVVADPSCKHLVSWRSVAIQDVVDKVAKGVGGIIFMIRSVKGEKAPILEGLVRVRVTEGVVVVPQNGLDVLSESCIEIDWTEVERRRVDANVHLHPVVTGAVGGVRVEIVNAHAYLVTRLRSVEDPLLIVQAEADAGVFNAGVLENDFVSPLRWGSIERGRAISL